MPLSSEKNRIALQHLHAIVEKGDVDITAIPAHELEDLKSFISDIQIRLSHAKQKGAVNLSFSKAAQNSLSPLNEREKEILTLIAQGKSNQKISELLDIKVSTVKWYNSNIFDKLCVESRFEATHKAQQLNII